MRKPRYRYRDLTGKRYGHLVAMWPAGRQGGQWPSVMWLCACDCGNYKIVMSGNLQKNSTKSCGCMTGKLISEGQTTHDMTHSPEYRSWRSMLDRCSNPNQDSWPNYGGRGIAVCDSWNPRTGGSFENFYKDVGPRPVGTTLGRKDNDGNYAKDNCQWETPRQQATNKRMPRPYTTGMRYKRDELHKLRTSGMTVQALARHFGVSKHTITVHLRASQ